MTPKEKAQELVNKFQDIENLGRFSEDNGFSSWSTKVLDKQSKECALIAVDEIINVTAPYCDRYEDYYQKLNETKKQEFWQQVKQKIEAL